jgi:hypothetical protein
VPFFGGELGDLIGNENTGIGHSNIQPAKFIQSLSDHSFNLASSVTSTLMANVFRPVDAAISAAVVVAVSIFKSATTTWAPSIAKRWQIARPKPWPPPVTKAI